MFKKLLLAAVLSLSASSAFAACTSPLVVKDASGNSINMSVTTGADGYCQYKMDIDTSSQFHTDITSTGNVNLYQGGAAQSATNGGYFNMLVGNAAVGTGTGAVGATTPRVAVGTDTATVAGTAPGTAGIAATGAAPPAGSLQVGAVGSGATGGLMAGLKTCDQHAKYDASDNGSITMVTGVSGRKVYICGFILATGGTATNLKLREGSDANCATNAADLTPAYQLVANDRVGMQAAFWTGLAVSTNAYYVCVNASAGNAHQAEVWYTIQ